MTGVGLSSVPIAGPLKWLMNLYGWDTEEERGTENHRTGDTRISLPHREAARGVDGV